MCYLWEESKEKPKKRLFFFNLQKFELWMFEFYNSNQFSLINFVTVIYFLNINNMQYIWRTLTNPWGQDLKVHSFAPPAVCSISFSVDGWRCDFWSPAAMPSQPLLTCFLEHYQIKLSLVMVFYHNRLVTNRETQKSASSVTLNLCSVWLASLHFSATAFINQQRQLCLSRSFLVSHTLAISALSSCQEILNKFPFFLIFFLS